MHWDAGHAHVLACTSATWATWCPLSPTERVCDFHIANGLLSLRRGISIHVTCQCAINCTAGNRLARPSMASGCTQLTSACPLCRALNPKADCHLGAIISMLQRATRGISRTERPEACFYTDPSIMSDFKRRLIVWQYDWNPLASF